MVTWNELTGDKTGLSNCGTCKQISVDSIMPKGRGSSDMYAQGLKPVQAFVSGARKQKLIEYCREMKVTQTEVINSALAEKLKNYTPATNGPC